MKNKRDRRIKFSYFSIWRFIFYFLFAGFIVTCSILLFFGQATVPDKDIVIMNETVNLRAVRTFCNLLFLCFFFSIFDSVKRKIFVGRPLRKILDATHRITEGDFTARIEPTHRVFGKNEFDIIIEDLNTMAQELSTTETLKTDFIANVSHEIKTPLTIIQNYATLLQEPSLSDGQRIQYAQDISNASKRLSSLVTNILKLNKLENQQIFPEITPYNLSEQICACVLLFEEEWEKKNLQLETDIAEDVFVNADKELFELVWVNIISNAIKFNRDGGKLSISLKAENNKATVKITDTGCGMNEEIGKHIFDKFYQADTSHAISGNGLGLALVKRVIDITGSEIKVDSELGKGTSFTVLLALNSKKQ